MKFLAAFKRLIIFAGDWLLLWLAFLAAIFIRFHFHFDFLTYERGLLPFLLLFLVWIFVFVMNHFYEFESFLPFRKFVRYFLRAFIINGLLAVSWFYFLSFTNFTPKTILFICWGLSFVFLFFWRYLVSVFIRQLSPTRVALIESPIASEIKNHLDLHPALGYQAFLYQNLEEFKEKFIADKIKLFVFESKKENEELILELAQNGISLALMSNFYEEIFGRVKLELINDEWFVNYFGFENWSYFFLKRLFDFLFALTLLTLTSPVALLVALAIKLTSPGPIFYRSLRLGQNLKPFQVYKFRTMIKEADKIGPALTLDNDKRITPLGRWLRKLHLDEWPQLINILAGELSVIGPRPVEVKLAETFNEKIKYYRLRHLVRPGVTGWAQLNYRYSASLEDEIKKLEYDLYYLKYRGFVLDFTIFIKSWRIPFDIKSH